MSILEKTGTVHLKSHVSKIVIKYEDGTEHLKKVWFAFLLTIVKAKI